MSSENPTVSDSEQTEPKWDPYRAVVRLIAGGVSLGAEGLRAADAAAGAEEGSAADAVGFSATLESATALIVGVAVETPDRIVSLFDTADRVMAPVRTAARPVVGALRQSFVGRVVGELGTNTAAEAARLAAVGRAEINQGRRLAITAYNEAVDGFIEQLSGRQSLDDLVSDQTLGVGKGAVEEVRETGAAADWLSESMFRRVLRRPPRSMPPKPSPAT